VKPLGSGAVFSVKGRPGARGALHPPRVHAAVRGNSRGEKDAPLESRQERSSDSRLERALPRVDRGSTRGCVCGNKLAIEHALACAEGLEPLILGHSASGWRISLGL
jgi:hypothetical protein